MDINILLDDARKSISDFCINECKAYCCRKGHLPLKKDEIPIVTQGRAKELLEKGILIWIDKEKASLEMGKFSCSSLDKDNKCKIHKNKKRPLVCSQFPIFLGGNTIRFSSRCLAVRDNLFFPYEKKMMKMGYKLYKSSSAYDSDFYDKL